MRNGNNVGSLYLTDVGQRIPTYEPIKDALELLFPRIHLDHKYLCIEYPSELKEEVGMYCT